MSESLPPDPRPRAPRQPLPRGAIDCHAHVFGPFDRFPVQAGLGYTPALAPFTSYVAMLKTIGCAAAVLVQPSPYGTDHSALLAALRSGDFPLRGVALYDEALADAAMAELHHFGVVGARWHVTKENARERLPQLPQVAQRIRKYGWHLQLYVELAAVPEVDRMLSALPVPVVIDHFGLVPARSGVSSPGFEALLRLAESERCWFKLSAPYRVSDRKPEFADVTPLAQALVAAAPGRCVWGTDWPHPNASFIANDGDLADLVASWIPDTAQRRRVLVANATELYGF